MPLAIQFHGRPDLNNDPGFSGSGTYPLGMPGNRFGHDRDMSTTGSLEYIDDQSGTERYIGRFTHEETSSPDFGYPTDLSSGINPMDFTTPLEFDSGTSGPIRHPGANGTLGDGDDGYYRKAPGQTNSRRAEDIVMTNVHSFDIKVWDPLAGGGSGAWVDIGFDDGGTATMYSSSAKSNTVYGPAGRPAPMRNVFDTWHPDVDSDGTPSMPPSSDSPPYLSRTGNVTGGVPQPLRAIQISIRFFDTTSQQTRDMTLVHEFVN